MPPTPPPNTTTTIVVVLLPHLCHTWLNCSNIFSPSPLFFFSKPLIPECCAAKGPILDPLLLTLNLFRPPLILVCDGRISMGSADLHRCRWELLVVRESGKGTLCNHFYFPLLASLPSDLDCISHGRQRHYERMFAMDARTCLPASKHGKRGAGRR